MKVSGFTFVRNGVKYDYPFIESISSLLPLCDKIIVAVGQSEDNTLERIKSLHAPKIKILETVWDESIRKGGTILALQTNLALDQIAGDWAIYLQADEVLHEQDYVVIKEAMSFYKDAREVEGLLLNYKHFYGSYNYIGDSQRWYRHEIRIVRPKIGVRSWGDAQGFRINGQKLHVKLIDAAIYHYGWVKPPDIQLLKQKTFNKFWHSDKWVDQYVGVVSDYNYGQSGKLAKYDGTHPSIMTERIRNQNWHFKYDPSNVQQPLKEKILDGIESRCGWRIGEYKNYIMI
ncbi:MAG: glycosyltransferase family 2 protein [Bacteroidota bacterium]|jgi:glycosyltransferase involved in cell wall biosynthesis